MSDDTNRLALRPAGELSETSCSQRIRNRLRRVPSLHSSIHSEHTIVSSSPMTPYTH
jgi:hypothetical protein